MRISTINNNIYYDGYLVARLINRTQSQAMPIKIDDFVRDIKTIDLVLNRRYTIQCDSCGQHLDIQV